MTANTEQLFCRKPLDGCFFVCYISFNFYEHSRTLYIPENFSAAALVDRCSRIFRPFPFSQRTQRSSRRLQDVLKRSRCLTTKHDVVTTSGKRRHIYDVLKVSNLWRLESFWFTTSWRGPIYVVLKTSDLRRLEDARYTSSWKRPINDVLKTSVKPRLCSNFERNGFFLFFIVWNIQKILNVPV